MAEKPMTLKVLEAVRAHSATVFGVDPVTIEVPEWIVDGAPLTFYVWPITWQESNEVYSAMEGGGINHMLKTFTVRAKDSNGNRMIPPAMETDLMAGSGPDPEIIKRVSVEIATAFQPPSEGESAKN